MNNISDSHDVVQYYMTLMNYICASDMKKNDIGIFRIVEYKNDEQSSKDSKEKEKEKENENENKNKIQIPDKINNFINILKNTIGKYGTEETLTHYEHKILGLEQYIHITSPIRRIVDLVNIIWYQRNIMKTYVSTSAETFLKNKINYKNIETLNTRMKNIRKIQNDALLISNINEYANNTYVGYIIDKEENTKNNENKTSYQYSIYIPEIKYIGKVISAEKYEIYFATNFKIIYLEDENTLHKKIRLVETYM